MNASSLLFPIPEHIQGWLADQPPSTRIVYTELLSRVRDPHHPTVAPGIKALMTATGLGRRIIFYALRRLEGAGLVRRNRTDSIHRSEITLVELFPAPAIIPQQQRSNSSTAATLCAEVPPESLAQMITRAGGDADVLDLLRLADGDRALVRSTLRALIASRTLPPRTRRDYFLECFRHFLPLQSAALRQDTP